MDRTAFEHLARTFWTIGADRETRRLQRETAGGAAASRDIAAPEADLMSARPAADARVIDSLHGDAHAWTDRSSRADVAATGGNPWTAIDSIV